MYSNPWQSARKEDQEISIPKREVSMLPPLLGRRFNLSTVPNLQSLGGNDARKNVTGNRETRTSDHSTFTSTPRAMLALIQVLGDWALWTVSPQLPYRPASSWGCPMGGTDRKWERAKSENFFFPLSLHQCHSSGSGCVPAQPRVG